MSTIDNNLQQQQQNERENKLFFYFLLKKLIEIAEINFIVFVAKSGFQ